MLGALGGVIDCCVCLFLSIYISDVDGQCCLEHWEESDCYVCLYLSICSSDVCISSRWSILLGALGGVIDCNVCLNLSIYISDVWIVDGQCCLEHWEGAAFICFKHQAPGSLCTSLLLL